MHLASLACNEGVEAEQISLHSSRNQASHCLKSACVSSLFGVISMHAINGRSIPLSDDLAGTASA